MLLSIEKPAEKERRQKAEVTCTSRARTSSSECTSEDLYAAIDQLMDKLDRQVVRHKDKVQNHHHAAPKRTDADAQLRRRGRGRCCRVRSTVRPFVAVKPPKRRSAPRRARATP